VGEPSAVRLAVRVVDWLGWEGLTELVKVRLEVFWTTWSRMGEVAVVTSGLVLVVV